MTSTREQPHIQLSAVCQVSDTLQNAEPTGRDNETVILEGNASKCPQRSQDMKVNAWNLAWVSPKKLLLQNPYAQALNICHWLALFFFLVEVRHLKEKCVVFISVAMTGSPNSSGLSMCSAGKRYNLSPSLKVCLSRPGLHLASC